MKQWQNNFRIMSAGLAQSKNVKKIIYKTNLVLIFHMQAESSSPDVTNIDESGENRQHRTPNLEG